MREQLARIGGWSLTTLLAAGGLLLFAESQRPLTDQHLNAASGEQPQLTSLDSPPATESAHVGAAVQAVAYSSTRNLASGQLSFKERFAAAFGPHDPVPGERFAAAFAAFEQESEPAPGDDEPPADDDLPLPPAAPSKKSSRVAEAPREPLSIPADRTAIYDITAQTVYLPNGERLEAHSGLGSSLDDPRYVNIRNQGPTPPNIYNLALRKEPFHGVRAIRLVPVDETKMFGRAGMLAHSYLLGPNGESNGCVSFRDYPAFLNAFLKGEIEYLVVVDRLDAAPPIAEAEPRSILKSIWNFLRPS